MYTAAIEGIRILMSTGTNTGILNPLLLSFNNYPTRKLILVGIRLWRIFRDSGVDPDRQLTND
jgi:hypothetical protein